MDEDQTRSTYRFQVECPQASGVYLLMRFHDRISQLLPMQPPSAADSRWHVEANLPPGSHTFRFYGVWGQRLICLANPKTHSVRVSSADPSASFPIRC